VSSPRGEHSAKPSVVYEIIERMYPALPKIELFARARRPGWDAWGNQAATAGANKPDPPRPEDLASVIAQLPRVAAEVEAGLETLVNEASAGDEVAG
jgi:hypothetical protein